MSYIYRINTPRVEQKFNLMKNRIFSAVLHNAPIHFADVFTGFSISFHLLLVENKKMIKF